MKIKFLTTKLKLQFLIIVGMLITACGCVKDNLQDELPPITQTGENTFGCVIDGEVLIPKDGKVTGPPGSSSPYKGVLVSWPERVNVSDYTIRAGNAWDDGGDHIFIYIYNLSKEGVYTLGKGIKIFDSSHPTYSHCFVQKQTNNKGTNYLSYENSGSIIITRYDINNKILSGIFNFKAVNENDPNDIIEILDGRFDFDINKPFNFK